MTTKVVTEHVSLDLTAEKEAVATYVDIEVERHRLTVEGLADVDAGRVFDHAAIRIWADSLSSERRLPV